MHTRFCHYQGRQIGHGKHSLDPQQYLALTYVPYTDACGLFCAGPTAVTIKNDDR